MASESDVLRLLVRLTGQEAPFQDGARELEGRDFFADGKFGQSKLNEVLLTLGFDRVSKPFFDCFLLTAGGGSSRYIQSVQALEDAIEDFRKKALLAHGNVKYAFKYWSQIPEHQLVKELKQFDQIKRERYTDRSEPVHQINRIDASESYLLGYLSGVELKKRLDKNPGDEYALNLEAKRRELVDLGKKNHRAYLTYDHMDVYVATSMRQRHEYYAVNQFVSDLFGRSELQELNLRYFDPTAAYCDDRIEKGLVEALMLKRAKCTIYLVQEADTLGKDSELASTLAQGKPVIAYVPEINEEEFRAYVHVLRDEIYVDYSEEELVKLLIKTHYAEGAWSDAQIQRWLLGLEKLSLEDAISVVFPKACEHYDARAKVLEERHPLAIQVNLDTGVANGLLVARSLTECAQLLTGIVLNTLEFEIDDGDDNATLLRESVTRSIYRVVSKDSLLTNSFWNFYLSDKVSE